MRISHLTFFNRSVPANLVPVIACSLFFAFLNSPLLADDWSTYRHDQRRSGVSNESVDARLLTVQWTWQSALPPTPAWPDSARWDAYAKLDGLRSMRDYDPVFHPVAADGKLFFASNSDDTLRCISLHTGKSLWQVTFDAPMRVAPTVHEGRVYVGCDAGYVYALQANSGALVWEKEVSPVERGFLNDGRLCSQQPVRTGVLIDPLQKCAIVAAGIFPWKRTSLVGLSLVDGSEVWRQDLGTGWTLEGAMLLGSEHIVAPQGRSPPQLFARVDGTPKGPLSGGGGSFALMTSDNELLHGPGNKDGWITTSSASTREKIASFTGGTAAVVDGDRAYLLSPSSLTCMDRRAGQLLWRSSLQCPHEVILVRDTLFTGGDDVVAAISAESGQLLWAQPVNGRAIGLAFSDGQLIVSTDSGQITVWGSGSTRENSISRDVAERLQFEQQQVDLESVAQGSPKRPDRDAGEGVLQHWFFHSDLVRRDGDAKECSLDAAVKQGTPLQLPANARFVAAGQSHALVLSEGVDAVVAKDFRDVDVPSKALSIAATVRIDRPQAWGGLLSVAQDNGSYEKGWMLGFRNNQFGMAINAAKGPDSLTWTLAKPQFTPGQWYHLVATYDGKAVKVYQNGKLVGKSLTQSGEIEYPENALMNLGSYRDDDEHFFTEGRLNEVTLLKRALSEAEVAAAFQLRRELLGENFFQAKPTVVAPARSRLAELRDNSGDLELTAGPELKFIRPGAARVRFELASASAPTVSISSGDATAVKIEAAGDWHTWELTGIGRNELVTFRIVNNQNHQSRIFECDGHFDYSRPLLPQFEIGSDWGAELGLADRHDDVPARGIALLWAGDDTERLAESLSIGAGLDVIAFLPKTERVTEARTTLLKRGLYGRPATVLEASRLSFLPSGVANIVIVASSTIDPRSQTDFADLLVGAVKPEGLLVSMNNVLPDGLAFGLTPLVSLPTRDSAPAVFRAPRTDGAAAWSHMYGSADNSAYAGESLADADSFDDLAIQWCGRPGPRYQSDRGNRKPSPLAAGGRLYLQGLHRLIGMDAHNGSILWAQELPEVVRFNVPRDCSNWCADEENLFVAAGDRCKVIDGKSGETTAEYDVWNPTDHNMDWGFVARHKNLLLGSPVQAGSSFTDYWGGEHWYDAKDGEHAKKVSSDALFALDAKTGLLEWSYQRGLVINPTIAVSANDIVFVECRSQKLISGATRRLDGDDLWNNLFVVSLNASTGRLNWETPAKPMPGVSALYGVIGENKYLLQSSQAGNFAMYAMDCNTGKMIWRGKYDWEADHHGKHLSRPAVVGGKVFMRPLTLDITNGTVLAKAFPVGHQCGTYTASKNALFLRAGSLTMWDGESSAASRLSRVRPDCWISTIPAEGMLLSPEGGGGCSCGGWIETSMGFAPISAGAMR